jgi:hypothetical protein
VAQASLRQHEVVRHLDGVDVEPGEARGTEARRDRHVGGVPAARDHDAADPAGVMARVEGVPARPVRTFEERLEPRREVHRVGVDRHPDVAEIPRAVAGRDVHAPTHRDGEVGEVAAHADLLVVAVEGGAGGVGELVVEPDALVHPGHDGLHPLPTLVHAPEQRPGRVGQLVGITDLAFGDKPVYPALVQSTQGADTWNLLLNPARD